MLVFEYIDFDCIIATFCIYSIFADHTFIKDSVLDCLYIFPLWQICVKMVLKEVGYEGINWT
jgi:hypothetical protein